MLSIPFLRTGPALAGLMILAACEHPRALPSAPSPLPESAARLAQEVDLAALQRTAAALAADPATAGAAREVGAGLPEAGAFALRLDAAFWARLEAAARSRAAASVLPR